MIVGLDLCPFAQKSSVRIISTEGVSGEEVLKDLVAEERRGFFVCDLRGKDLGPRSSTDHSSRLPTCFRMEGAALSSSSRQALCLL